MGFAGFPRFPHFPIVGLRTAPLIALERLTRDGGRMGKVAAAFGCESSQRAHIKVREVHPFKDTNDVLNLLCSESRQFINEFLVAARREAKTFRCPWKIVFPRANSLPDL